MYQLNLLEYQKKLWEIITNEGYAMFRHDEGPAERRGDPKAWECQ